MSQEIDALKREVAESNDVIQSAITLLAGLASRIMALRGDPRALRELASELNAQQEALAAAVAANTPDGEEPGPSPSETPSPTPEPTPAEGEADEDR